MDFYMNYPFRLTVVRNRLDVHNGLLPDSVTVKKGMTQ